MTEIENMESDVFGGIFDKYRDQTGKYESMYIFVVYDLVVEQFIDKIKKMLGIIEEIPNSSRRIFLKTRLGNLLKYLEGIKPETMLDNIYLISEDAINFPIRKYWKETLIKFQCDKILYKYDEKFNIDWLKELLLDRSFIHILHVKNNNLKHFHLNKTKKRIHIEKEEKGMLLNLYINENIKNDICLVHGISSLIKTLIETSKIKLLSGNKSDDELIL